MTAMDDSRPGELAAKIAVWRASIARSEASCETRTLSAREARGQSAASSDMASSASSETADVAFDPLERALAAERRLESLVRLAASILPPQNDPGRASWRPPSAWRAFARELSRAKRHLSRSRGEI